MNYHKITKADIANGTGVRVVLWVSGCEHYCKDCHNPQTWDYSSGVHFNDETLNELRAALEPDYISGLTLSGGDPLAPANRTQVSHILKRVKELFPNKTIWLYTGYNWDEIKAFDLIQYIDVIVDGEYVSDKRDITLPWRGSSNQRVIDVKKSKEQHKLMLYCEQNIFKKDGN